MFEMKKSSRCRDIKVFISRLFNFDLQRMVFKVANFLWHRFRHQNAFNLLILKSGALQWHTKIGHIQHEADPIDREALAAKTRFEILVDVSSRNFAYMQI